MALKEDKNGVLHDELGHWPKLQSGNPKGRPPRVIEMENAALWDQATPADEKLRIARSIVEKALAGEQWAIILVARRLWPENARLDVALHPDNELVDLSDDQIHAILASHEQQQALVITPEAS